MIRLPITRETENGHIFQIRHSIVKGYAVVYIHRTRDMMSVLNPEGRKGPWIRKSRGSAIATADMLVGEYGGWREGSVWE